MDQRTLGQTGRKVTRLGLGLAALGRPGYINLGHGTDFATGRTRLDLQRRCHEVLDAAWIAGIRYFDVARSYGHGEEFLASWLSGRRISPELAIVASKWGYTYTANWQVEADKHEIKDHSLAMLTAQWKVSCARLGKHLTLYQIHSATQESGVLQNHDVLAELARIKRTGMRIGLTVTGPKQADTVRAAVAVQVDGERLFDCVQATWNVLEPSVGPALVEAHAAGLGVIIKEALANGRLTLRNQSPDFARQRKLLADVATERRTTIGALSLAAVLNQPWADVVLSGAATLDQLHGNLRALEVIWDDSLLRRLAALVERPEAYWQTRSGLAWN